MEKWNFYGTERRDKFLEELEPKALEATLSKYRRTFGQGFSIADLLVLEDIRAKALIAQAINDAPEFLIDQIYKGWDEDGMDSIRESFKVMANCMGDAVGLLSDEISSKE